MSGKGASSLVLCAVLCAGACAGGCATAGGPDGDADGAPIEDATSGRESGAPGADAAGGRTPSGDAAGAGEAAGGADAEGDDAGPTDASAPSYPDILVLGDEFSLPVDAGDEGDDAAPPPDASGSLDAGAVDASAADADAAGPDAGSGAAPDAGLDATSAGGADASADAGACGACDGGFACGPSGYCAASTGVPAFGHVYVVVMEQQSLSAVQGDTSASYIPSLIASYALATDYVVGDHPSLPNYFELTSGSDQGVTCDCDPGGTPSCGATCAAGTCDCPQSTTSHLGDELDSAGIEWREYAEGMGAPCNAGSVDAGAYFAVSHVPFMYYDDVYTTPGRCAARVVDYGDFAGDLAAGAYRFAMISPDQCHDMQINCSGNPVGDPILQGDEWLSTNVPAILATPGFASGGADVLFVVWEEAGLVGSYNAPLIVVSPLVRPGSTTSAAYGHASLLATIEDGLGVARLGASASASPITDVWR